MKVYLPYTKLVDATLISLRFYDFEMVKLTGKYGYSRYFKQRWDQGESFINIEHDTVLWPGALEPLMNCPEIWCAYDQFTSDWSTQISQGIRHGVPLATMKFDQKFIERFPDVWDESVDWHECDIHLFKSVDVNPHQHFPGIINANKELTKIVKKDFKYE